MNKATAFRKKAMQEPDVRKYMQEGMFTDVCLGPAEMWEAMPQQDAAFAKQVEALGPRKVKTWCRLGSRGRRGLPPPPYRQVGCHDH